MAREFHPRRIPDEDAEALRGIAHLPVQPIFIMGLHRSGTTFLYQCLADAFPVAPLTLHDLVFYPRLLNRRAGATPEADREALQAWMDRQLTTTRGIDNIPMTPDMVEEYGFLLQRFSGRFELIPANQSLFEGLCRKLLYLNQGSQGVLLKSPLDQANGPRIHGLYPQARFVYISRDPVQILQSQYNNIRQFATNPPPLLDILLQRFPLARIGVLRHQLLDRLVGKEQFSRWTVPGLMRDVLKQLEAYRRSLEGLPESVRIEVCYQDLMREPGQILERIGTFLGLDMPAEGFDVTVSPRSGRLYPEIERIKQPFAEMLKERGLWSGPGPGG